MVKTFRPAFLTLALLVGAAPAFAQGTNQGTNPGMSSSTGTTAPAAAGAATPANPAGQVAAPRPAQVPAAQGQVTTRPAQPSGTAATTPAPSAPRTN